MCSVSYHWRDMWGVSGVYLECIWSLSGVYLGCIWNVSGVCVSGELLGFVCVPAVSYVDFRGHETGEHLVLRVVVSERKGTGSGPYAVCWWRIVGVHG